MKKCASCSKDLPEAALHCVFCGAKQAPAPAVPASNVAKTAFGYSANEVMAQLGNQQPPAQGAPYQPPQQRAQPQAQPAPARPHPGSQPPPVGYPQPGQPGGLAPQSAANAATMYVPGGGPPAPAQQNYNQPPPQYGGSPGYSPPAPSPGFGQASPGYSPPPPAYSPPGGGMGIHSPQQPTPAPLPAVPQPYLGAHSGVARAGRPVEPWKDSLRLMMFVWGAVLLASFATPLATSPMMFNWDAIIDGEGSAKIPALVWAGAGLLAIVFAAIPMVTLPRGALAAVLGLSGVFLPMAVAGTFPEWQQLLQLVGMLVLVPGLLLRHEYVESLLARVLVTIGVICTLLPYLVPEGGQIPLVMLIKALIEAGSGMEFVIVHLANIVLAVLCLLVWMPGPATAGAKIFAWVVILFPIAAFLLRVLGNGDIGAMISDTPGQLLSWAPGVSYTVLIGYGLATVLGKQLE